MDKVFMHEENDGVSEFTAKIIVGVILAASVIGLHGLLHFIGL